jgi:hypothetical protein
MTNAVYGSYRRKVVAKAWTEKKIKALGMMCDIETASQIIGISRTTAYRMARAGTFPAQIHRLGRVYRVSVASLLVYLNGPDEESE